MATSMHYGATKEIFQHAERLRKNMTAAEKIIWKRLSRKQLGIRIRRQHPIWRFIADFYCHELKLVIEIDGGIHLSADSKEYDISRQITLEDFGIRIVRFSNERVVNETDKVIEEIIETISRLKGKNDSGT